MSKIVYVGTGTNLDNTTTETDLASFDVYEYLRLTGQTLPNQGYSGLRLTLGGSLEENVGGTPTFSFKSYVNNVVACQVDASPVGGLPTFKHTFTLLSIPGTTSHRATAELLIGGPTAAGSELLAVQMAGGASTSLAETFTVKTTITMSTASVDVGIATTLIYIELL